MLLQPGSTATTHNSSAVSRVLSKSRVQRPRDNALVNQGEGTNQELSDLHMASKEQEAIK